MGLAPIRGAPPGAPNPDFPAEKPKATPAKPTAAPVSVNRHAISSIRQAYTPIEIGGGGVAFTFRVIPEQPAIARASMTVHVVAKPVGSSAPQALGFLRMSAANARAFLTDLRNGRFPSVATGDEDGTVQIECESTEAGAVLLVHKPGEQHASLRLAIDKGYDLKVIGDELLADLGA
jgi:hypothetical protein